MFSDKLTPVQYDNFLPFLPVSNDKKIIITDQTKVIAKELRKERILPPVLDFILTQLGVFSDE